jgi:hypothetical protein
MTGTGDVVVMAASSRRRACYYTFRIRPAAVDQPGVEVNGDDAV